MTLTEKKKKIQFRKISFLRFSYVKALFKKFGIAVLRVLKIDKKKLGISVLDTSDTKTVLEITNFFGFTVGVLSLKHLAKCMLKMLNKPFTTDRCKPQIICPSCDVSFGLFSQFICLKK